MVLPTPLLLLLLTSLTPISAYAIVEPLSQPTATLKPRQQSTPAPIPNLAAASISASLASSFSAQLAIQTNSVQSLQLANSVLERNLAETRRGLSSAQAQAASATRALIGAASPDPNDADDGGATALPDAVDCQTALPRPQALCSGTARAVSIAGFVIGGIGLIALGFASIVFCRWRQRRQSGSEDGRSRTTSVGDNGTISTAASTRREKQRLAQMGASLFSPRARTQDAGRFDEGVAATRQNNRAASQRRRIKGTGNNSDAPAHMSISAPQPGSGPIRSESEQNLARPQLARQLSGQEGSGETLMFVLGPDNGTESSSNNRYSTASQDYLIGSESTTRRDRDSGESSVIPRGTIRVLESDPERMSAVIGPGDRRSFGGGRRDRDTLSREYQEVMDSMSISTRDAPVPTILSPTMGSTRMRERMI